MISSQSPEAGELRWRIVSQGSCSISSNPGLARMYEGHLLADEVESALRDGRRCPLASVHGASNFVSGAVLYGDVFLTDAERNKHGSLMCLMERFGGHAVHECRCKNIGTRWNDKCISWKFRSEENNEWTFSGCSCGM